MIFGRELKERLAPAMGGGTVKPKFVAMLPGELQAAVLEIEQIAGCEIAVVPDATAGAFDNLVFGIEAGSCRATIAYCGYTVSRCAIVHEVLHLRRCWLDAVPILRSTSSRHAPGDAEMLDELVEHLVIIPEEQRFEKTESNAHWATVMAAKLAELPTVSSSLNNAQIVALKRGLMLQRAMMDIALPDLDHTALYERLRKESFFDESAAFSGRLSNMLHDKMGALIFVSQEFGYDLATLCVGKFNIRDNPKSFTRSAPLARSSW